MNQICLSEAKDDDEYKTITSSKKVRILEDNQATIKISEWDIQVIKDIARKLKL